MLSLHGLHSAHGLLVGQPSCMVGERHRQNVLFCVDSNAGSIRDSISPLPHHPSVAAACPNCNLG